MRQIVLDTETTGLEPVANHRVIEIGCVELIDRRLTGEHFHQYLQPDREIEVGAEQVHGITDEFLRDKPRFAAIAEAFIEFVHGAELVIHNAPFDVGFLNHELALWRADAPRIEDICTVEDTLVRARSMHPGQRNSLDALCKRYGIDNAHRELHGALLDAEILADVYLAMTGGQVRLALGQQGEEGMGPRREPVRRLAPDRPRLAIVRASPGELAAHQQYLAAIQAASGHCLWIDLNEEAASVACAAS